MNDKIHLLFFCPYLGGGGAELHLVRLIKALDDTLFRKTVVVCKRGGSYEEFLKDCDVHIESLGVHWRKSTVRLVASVPRLARAIRHFDPDIVFSIMDSANVFCGLAHRLSRHRSKLLVDIQGTIAKALDFSPKTFDRLVFAMMKRLYPRADKILCLSHGVADELQRVLPRTQKAQYAVIHNIGLEKVGSLEATVRHKGQVCVCGRLVELKGVDLVLHAISEVRKRGREVSLIVVGTGPEELRLKSLASELGISAQVQFLGFVADPQRYMAESEVVVVSSYFEGFCNVIVESMAVGTPVISTDCPYGPAEIIESGRSGLLVKVGDSSGIAGAIDQLLSDSRLYASVQVEGLRRAADFQPEIIAKQHQELLLELVRTPS